MPLLSCVSSYTKRGGEAGTWDIHIGAVNVITWGEKEAFDLPVRSGPLGPSAGPGFMTPWKDD